MDHSNGTAIIPEDSPRNEMKTVVWEGKPFDVSVQRVPVPKLKEPEDAIVEITTSALCGTDLHTYHGLLGSSNPPWAIGHEGIGIVREVGPAVDSFKSGDRVIVAFDPRDGEIERPVGALSDDLFGFGAEFGSEMGLQSEYARVPKADSSLVKLPPHIDDREWICLADIFPTGWTGLDFANFQAGNSVAVFGAGPVGLMCAYSAIIRGASIVYVVDHVPARLAKAASIGAVPINFQIGGEASSQILRLRPEGVKHVVDCVGEECVNAELKPQQDYVINEAVKITAFDGNIGVIGVYVSLPISKGVPRADIVKPNIKFPITDLFFRNISIKGGSMQVRKVIPQLVELVSTGRARPGFVVSAEYDLADAKKAYDRFDKHLETKVLFRSIRRSNGVHGDLDY